MARSMNIRAMCMGRAYEFVRSGSFRDVEQLKHRLNAEGYEIYHLNERGLSRGLALHRMYLSRQRITRSIGLTGDNAAIRRADEVIDDFKIVVWPRRHPETTGSCFPLQKD